jgi:hypothetical protein
LVRSARHLCNGPDPAELNSCTAAMGMATTPGDEVYTYWEQAVDNQNTGTIGGTGIVPPNSMPAGLNKERQSGRFIPSAGRGKPFLVIRLNSVIIIC